MEFPREDGILRLVGNRNDGCSLQFSTGLKRPAKKESRNILVAPMIFLSPIRVSDLKSEGAITAY